jgi:catechol 2,3-dioxygenase-like lactoylglutathione lyase family enzyme
MAGERTYPILPCADLDATLAFYAALGFEVTFRQIRPNPHAVVAFEDIAIHLSGIDGFDPAASYGSAIITVPDPGALHDAFAAGLKRAHGRVPRVGIPRVLPLRRKAGTATGFSVVDPGGNWLRFYRIGATEDDPEEQRTGLGRVIDVAARQGDSRGDERQAVAVLTAGITRYQRDAPAALMVEALLYRAELLAHVGDQVAGEGDLAAAALLIGEHRLGAQAGAALQQAREALEGDKSDA